MDRSTVAAALQMVVGLGLLNVWIVRARSATAYRGGAATSLRSEFAVYGLPPAAFYVVGGLKLSAALLLIAGVFVELPVAVGAAVVAALMVGAVGMHVKVGDAAHKSAPAMTMFAMSVAIVLLTA